MTRSFAILLAAVVAVAVLGGIGVAARAAARRATPAADPLAAAPVRPDPAAPSAAARTSDLCISGPGAFAAALSDHVDLAALPAIARRAFAAERLVERATTGPAFPQRMGLAVPTAPPPTCVP
jgi:hypothetical protein